MTNLEKNVLNKLRHSPILTRDSLRPSDPTLMTIIRVSDETKELVRFFSQDEAENDNKGPIPDILHKLAPNSLTVYTPPTHKIEDTGVVTDTEKLEEAEGEDSGNWGPQDEHDWPC